MFATTPLAAVPIQDNEHRSAVLPSTWGWDGNLSSIEFLGNVPVSENPADVSAVLDIAQTAVFAATPDSTDQRIRIADGKAGAVMLYPNTNITIRGNSNTLADNGFGGAVYVGSGAVFALQSGTTGNTFFFSENTAKAGGAFFFNNTQSVVLFAAAAVKFTANAAASGNGGAIYAENAIQVRNTDALTFQANTAASNGGAIFVNESIVITGITTFVQNSASNGGAIYAEGAFSAQSATTFQKNEASISGGAIYANGKVVFGTSAQFSQNTAGGGVGGGAIYAAGDISIGADALFADNSSDASGGAIYISGGVLTLGGATQFRDNLAGSGNGGAVFAKNALAVSAAAGVDVLLDGNTTHGVFGGGAIYASKDLSLAGNFVFAQNSADASGGAIYLGGETLTLDGSAEFRGNTAANGGAILASRNLNFTGTGNVTFTGNTATTGDGGAVRSLGNVSFAQTARFGGDTAGEGNTAAGGGGAIWLSGATLTLAGGGQFSYNTAASGGAVRSNGALSITHSGELVFTGNRATNAVLGGGAIFSSGALSMGDGAVFAKNNATGAGGAIYAKGNVSLGDGTRFGGAAADSANTAVSGGAIWLSGSTLTLGATTVFRGNSATSGGGGAIVATGALEIIHAGSLVFTANTATSGGGAIHVTGALVLHGNTLFKENAAATANTGGAVSASNVRFDTAAGIIFFTANKAGGAPNALALAGGTSVFTGAREIVFDDPLSHSPNPTSANALTSDAALVQFARNSKLNPDGAAGGGVHVTGGVFRILEGSVFDTGGDTNTVFKLGRSATLEGAGTVRAAGGFQITGVVSPDKHRFTPDSADLAATGTTTGVEAAVLTLHGDVTFLAENENACGTLRLQLGATAATSDKLVIDGSLAMNPGSTLEISGYNPSGASSSFPATSNKIVIVETTGGITRFEPELSIDGQLNSVDFLTTRIGVEGLNVVMDTMLTWYSTEGGRPAHGDFTVANNFTLTGGLSDNSNAASTRRADWQGSALTKNGEGVLTLAGSGTYSGGTMLNKGVLRLSAENAAGTGAITMKEDTQLELNFTGTFANTVSGTGEISATNTADVTVSGDIEGTNLKNAGTIAGQGTYRLSSLTNSGHFVAASVNTRAVITNLAEFEAQSISGTIVNGSQHSDATTVRFKGGSISGSIVNHGIFEADEINTPATGFDQRAPLIVNNARFTANVVTGSVENHGTFTAQVISAPASGLASGTPLVENTGTFEALSINGSIVNGAQSGDTAATLKADAVSGGNIVNHGTFEARIVGIASDIQTTSGIFLTNTGNFTADTVTGTITNEGSFKARNVNMPEGGTQIDNPLVTNNYGASFEATVVRGSLVNNGTATLGDVSGALTNAGIIRLSANAQWNDLDNSGGQIDFISPGSILSLASLNAGYGDAKGLIRMNIDLSNPENSNRLEVHGEISGQHHFILIDTNPSSDLEGITVINAPNNTSLLNETVSGEMVTFLSEYTFMENGNGGYLLGKTSKFGPGTVVIANSTGAISIGWFSQLDNLHKRFGELRDTNRTQTSPKTNTPNIAKTSTQAPLFSSIHATKTYFWTRGYAQQINANLNITGMRAFREYQYGADIGADREFSFDSDNRFFLGAFTGYYGAQRDFRDAYGSKGNTSAAVVGAYGIWQHKDGFFFDSDFKFQYMSTQYDALLDHADYGNLALGFSARIGYTFSLSSDFFIEPNMGISYLHIFAYDYLTKRGVNVRSYDSDIRRFEINARIGKTFSLGNNHFLIPSLNIGAESQSSDGGNVRVGSHRLTPNTDGTRGTVGAAVVWQLDESQQFHFDYEYVFGDKYEKPWSINIGYRKVF
ncbi:MAG: autotransporter outer membrane beta-barrel domain-containing protein [Puniceicoccales bacterium]|nr:autotransporter outer membrane beta-barrel domain-containing protein [Puniceicoccales bacterium]